MSLISDEFHNKKLNKYGINIKTKYFVGNKIYERNTDNSVNDDIKSGIRCKKEYYVGKKLVHKENLFDSRIYFQHHHLQNYLLHNFHLWKHYHRMIYFCWYIL